MQKTHPLRRLRTAVAVVIAACVVSGAFPASAAPLVVKITDAQITTITGGGPSLRDIVIELCKRGNVQLLAYDAPDRAFNAKFTDEPLHAILARLLRAESYMVGLRSGPGGDPQVAWLRIIGDPGANPLPLPVTGSARPAAPAVDVRNLPRMLPAGLFSADRAVRDKAMEKVVATVRQDNFANAEFIRTRPIDIAEGLSSSPHAISALTALATKVENNNVRRHLHSIVGVLQRQRKSR